MNLNCKGFLILLLLLISMDSISQLEYNWKHIDRNSQNNESYACFTAITKNKFLVARNRLKSLALDVIDASGKVLNEIEVSDNFLIRDVYKIIKIDHDNYFIIGNKFVKGGNLNFDLVVIKFALKHEKVLWYKQFGGSNLETFIDAYIDENKNLNILSNSSSSDNMVPNKTGKIWLFKIDTTGEIIFNNKYGCNNHQPVVGMVPDDNAFNILGSAKGIKICECDFFWRIDIHSDTPDYQHCLEKKIPGIVGFFKSRVLSNGDILIFGTNSNDPNDLAWIACYNSDFEYKWETELGKFRNETIVDIKERKDGGIIVIGHAFLKKKEFFLDYVPLRFWIASFDQEGKLENLKTYNGDDNVKIESFSILPENNILLSGQIYIKSYGVNTRGSLKKDYDACLFNIKWE